MCKKQDTKVIKTVNRLFAMDAVVMGVLLSVVGWSSLEIVSSNEAIASFKEKHIVIEKNFLALSETNETLLRMELRQEYFNTSMTREITLIKKSLASLEQVQTNKQ